MGWSECPGAGPAVGLCFADFACCVATNCNAGDLGDCVLDRVDKGTGGAGIVFLGLQATRAMAGMVYSKHHAMGWCWILCTARSCVCLCLCVFVSGVCVCVCVRESVLRLVEEGGGSPRLCLCLSVSPGSVALHVLPPVCTGGRCVQPCLCVLRVA